MRGRKSRRRLSSSHCDREVDPRKRPRPGPCVGRAAVMQRIAIFSSAHPRARRVPCAPTCGPFPAFWFGPLWSTLIFRGDRLTFSGRALAQAPIHFDRPRVPGHERQMELARLAIFAFEKILGGCKKGRWGWAAGRLPFPPLSPLPIRSPSLPRQPSSTSLSPHPLTPSN